MNFEEAKNRLKEGYTNLGLELADEHQRELFFRNARGDFLIRIADQEIEEFAECENMRSSFEISPVECCVCSQGYREHVVNFSEYDRRRLFPFRDRVYVFGERSEENLFCEISTATNLFVNYFRFDEAFSRIAVDRLRRPLYRGNREGAMDMYEVIYRPITIRLFNINSATIEAAIRKSTPILESCLFGLSYLKGITLILEEEWQRRQPRVRPFQFGERFDGFELPLPRVNFNSDTIRFYQRGMSTDDPFIQCLSFYQVLEYYFVSISEEQLYNKLSQRINDLKFSTSPKNLDRLIQDTLTHKRETDETEMLKYVIFRFVDENEIVEFIKAYEEYLSENLYTKKRTIFGESVEVRLNPGHVIGNLAKRIKIIRNALVHSSDRYERQQRYIPTSGSEKMIRKEIPLLRFLAEKVITGSI
ncbi:MAG: hypothetical protein JRI94_10840 [Deltaproteobacteria bacterium]|nr:hypothetical protein [Deltaproteobacteria bacterium]